MKFEKIQILPLLVAVLNCSLAAPGSGKADDQIDFEKQVQPIFREHCIACHGPDKQKSGYRLDSKSSALGAADFAVPSILPGNGGGSPLIQLVSGTHADGVTMPKGDGRKLNKDEIATLRIWIDQGAQWPDHLAGRKSGLAGTDHWIYEPIAAVSPPATTSNWPTNPIDAFILDKLGDAKLKPSEPASRAAILRRIYLSMHGLPPTPEQTRRFINDTSPDAYDKLVEEVLASPRYGERWAQHWLDVVRYADTHGFEVNTPRDNAWPYRDYVIRALNEDRPYDRFVTEQLVGDQLGEGAATGFLVTSAVLLPGQIGKDEDSKKKARQDELDEIVANVGSAFMGLTVTCARCHNHKFDAVSQKDYYSMQAIFSGVHFGDRFVEPPGYDKTKRSSLEAEIKKLKTDLTKLAKVRPPVSALGNSETFPPVEAQFVRFTINATSNNNRYQPCIDELEVFAAADEAGSPRNVALASAGAVATASGTWGNNTNPQHKLVHVNDGQYGNSRSWISEKHGGGWVQIQFAKPEKISRIEWARDRLGGFADRLATDYKIEVALKPGEWQQVAGSADRLRPEVSALANTESFPPLEAQFVRFTINATSNNNRYQPCIDELEVFAAADEAGSPRNVALSSAGAVATASGTLGNNTNPKHKLVHINDGQYGNSRSWISEKQGGGWVQIQFAKPEKINRIEWARDRQGAFADRLAIDYKIEVALKPGEWQQVASSADRMPKNTGLPDAKYLASLISGSKDRAAADQMIARIGTLKQDLEALPKTRKVYAGVFRKPEPSFRLRRGDPNQPLEPVVPDAITRISSLELPAGTPDHERRRALAKWLTDTKNPLTARVMVNRVWHYHFGNGIVDTPSDLGTMGGKPSHPELLDWLANEFMSHGWSLKHLHRLILHSSTWRQDSAPDSVALAKDSDSRLLWRFPPRRLEGEAIRDSVLAATGVLDLKMGGPGFSLFKSGQSGVQGYSPKESFAASDWRRMIYTYKVRMEQDSVFSALDIPDGGRSCSKRDSSTTPIQALNLFNSTFMIQQSELLAKRVREEAGEETQDQVNFIFEEIFLREPNAVEFAASVETAKAHGLETLCRVIFNTNEFLFIP